MSMIERLICWYFRFDIQGAVAYQTKVVLFIQLRIRFFISFYFNFSGFSYSLNKTEFQTALLK